MGKYIIKPAKSGGCVFDLKADNGLIVARSQVYATTRTCKKGIASVRTNAPIAKIEDQTKEDWKKLTCPKFEIYTDEANETRFRLKARNGQIIAASQGYNEHESAYVGIESIIHNCESEIHFADADED